MSGNALRCTAVLLSGALLAAPAIGNDAAANTAGRKAPIEDSCSALPPTIKLESGRYILERREHYWKVTKGSRPPRDFAYTSSADNRIYRFTYWNNKEYRCADTGRTSN